MAIYDFSSADNKTSPVPKELFAEEVVHEQEASQETPLPEESSRRFFSSLAARLFFFLLFVGDVLWTCYSLLLLTFSFLGTAFSGGKAGYFIKLREHAWVSLRRSLVCGVSLLIALFSPSFGIMIACTYFLMYDKSGIDEVVPSSLQSQIKEFFPKE